MAVKSISESVDIVSELTSLNQELCKRDAQMAQERLLRAVALSAACFAALVMLFVIVVALLGVNVFVASGSVVVTTVATLGVALALLALFAALLWVNVKNLSLKQTLLYKAWKGDA